MQRAGRFSVIARPGRAFADEEARARRDAGGDSGEGEALTVTAFFPVSSQQVVAVPWP